MNQPLMPKATAVWLIDNTALTFEQIADFCSLHILEVKGIADGDVDHGIRGADPIAAGQLTRLEIEDCQKDKNARLKAIQKRDIFQKLLEGLVKNTHLYLKDRTGQILFFG